METLLTTDDKLKLRAQKHEIGLEGEVEKEWWRECVPTGPILGYWRKSDRVQIGVEEYKKGPNGFAKQGFRPVQARTANIRRGLTIYACSSYIDLILGPEWLTENGAYSRTRYNLALEAVVAASNRGIIRYAGRGAMNVILSKREALRHRLLRCYRAVEYEHDAVILDSDIAEMLFTELRVSGQVQKEYPHTLYLKGWDSKSSLLVKVYDRRTAGQGPGCKIEITLRKQGLEAYGLREPKAWGIMPDIQGKIEAVLKREYGLIMQRAPRTKKMLCDKLGVRQANLIAYMVSPQSTLMGVTARLEAIERKQADFEQRMIWIEKMHADPMAIAR